jgi:hypothetical protein
MPWKFAWEIGLRILRWPARYSIREFDEIAFVHP